MERHSTLVAYICLWSGRLVCMARIHTVSHADHRHPCHLDTDQCDACLIQLVDVVHRIDLDILRAVHRFILCVGAHIIW